MSADRRADEIMTAIYGWDTKRDAVCDILADLHRQYAILYCSNARRTSARSFHGSGCGG